MTNSIAGETRATPVMIPQYVPVWAEIFGEDRFGIFAEFSVRGVQFALRWIPPGRFLMGSSASEVGRDSDESPQHRVTISRGFWLGETPVTQAQWGALMEENPSRFYKGGDQHPVEQVTWHQSVEFAIRLSELLPGLYASLPTEAQWEHACRAGSPSAFNDGSDCTQPNGWDPALDQLGWFGENSNQTTHPVKQKRRNKWGLYDMHGNVWEWCLDGKRIFNDQPQMDPLGTMEEGADRVMRGGSWGGQALYCRVAYRNVWLPGLVWFDLGLRLSAGQEPGLRAERRVP